MLNKIMIMGRLVKDPELRKTPTGVSVASFRIACDRDYTRGEEKAADFFDIVAWRATGEFVCKWFKKGDPILLQGRLQMRDWQDREGQKRRSFEIVAEEAWFCGGKKKESAQVETPHTEELDGMGDDDSPFSMGDDDLPM